MSAAPEVAVVVATRDREDLLRRLLDSLEQQDLAPERFEVVVVDDGSADGTPALLEQRAAAGPLRLLVLRREGGRGPAQARDAGWRTASAPFVAFTDDDCVATPGWLSGLLAAARRAPGSFVMGRTDPDPEQVHRMSPFTRTIEVHRAGPPYETCNILYPREVLERLDGFDLTYPRPGGEDTDLGWRAEEAGHPVIYAPDAVVHHAVLEVGPVANLKYALRWETSVPVFKRHPGLRPVQLHRGIFWTHIHEQLLRAVLALLLPRRAWPLALWLAWPYLVRLGKRRTGPLLAPYLLLYDVLELYAIARGAWRARVFVL